MRFKRIAASFIAAAMAVSFTQVYAVSEPTSDGSTYDTETEASVGEAADDENISEADTIDEDASGTEETWEANFVFDEETGKLEWDNYVEPNEFAGKYTVYADGNFLGWGFSFVLNDGSISKPYLNLPIAFAKVKSDGSLTPTKGTYEITVEYTDTSIAASGSFSYQFNGGDVDPAFPAPEIESVYFQYVDNTDTCGIHAVLKEHVNNAIGYIINLYNDSFNITSYDYVHSWNNEVSYYVWQPPQNKYNLRVRAVDIVGNMSEWSEPWTVDTSEQESFYKFEPDTNSFPMTVTKANWNSESGLMCNADFVADIPGVTYGKTTLGELKELYKGFSVDNFVFKNCTRDDISAGDFKTSLFVLTDKDGVEYGGWNSVFGRGSMSFEYDVNANDDDIVRSIGFQISLEDFAIIRNKMQEGDQFVVNIDTDSLIEYEGNLFRYAETYDGIAITGGIINNPDVIIPAEINGKPVTEISEYAFNFERAIETLVIPENVKRLKWYAFNTCENLTEITLPESLEEIDRWVFERCYLLKTVTIPKNVKLVRGGAFAQNTNMTSIQCDPLNSNYVSVNGVLFTKNMKELTAYPCGVSGDYTVPASVEHIGDAAFYGAKKLTAVEILGTLDFIGFEAFAECELLTDLYINEGVNYVGYWAFSSCSGIKLLTVPQSVTNIGDEAFGYVHYGDKLNDFTLRGYKDSAIYYYAIRHDIPFIIIGDADAENNPFKEENEKETEVAADPNAKEEDSVTSIIINPAFNMKDKSEAGVGLDLTKIEIKAEEIYDEEGLERVSEVLGEEINGNKHYNLLDLTLIYDGEDFSDRYDGLVEVIIPIPTGHLDKEFYCYRLVEDENGNLIKEIIPGKRIGDNYVIYLEHFSTYALIGDGDHQHEYSENWESDENNHWHECSCGDKTEPELHTASDWITDRAAAGNEAGSRHIECTVCGRILSEEEIPAEGGSDNNQGGNSGAPSGGSFVVPNTGNTESTSEPDNTTAPENASQPENTESGNATASADENGENNEESTAAAPSESISAAESTVGDSPENNNGANGTQADKENGKDADKNQNTGALIPIIPAIAAAAGIIAARKRK